MNRMIWYCPAGDEHDEAVMVEKILYLSKSRLKTRQETLIHLVGGTILRSSDSMKTLRARINSDDSF